MIKEELASVSILIAALTNPQCHWDLAGMAPEELELLLAEAEHHFYLLLRTGADS